MVIKFLKAGNGDCILLQGGGHNVIIDSGAECEELQNIVKEIIALRESINLLIISHYDSDHIKAICNIFSKLPPLDRKELVKCVWFNATQAGFKENEKDLSANDAVELGHLLLEADIPWVSELKQGMVLNVSDECQMEVIDGGVVFEQKSIGGLLSNVKSDWETSFDELEKFIDDDAQDSSKTNAQSAIIVSHINGKHILLPGDAIPSKLSDALDYYRNGKIAKFDLVKLPHHGSYKNITQAILEKMECSDYMITTDGTQFYHPNKKMMLKVIKWGKMLDGKPLTFHLNYDELISKMNITDEDYKAYGFNCDGKRTFEF